MGRWDWADAWRLQNQIKVSVTEKMGCSADMWAEDLLRGTKLGHSQSSPAWAAETALHTCCSSAGHAPKARELLRPSVG